MPRAQGCAGAACVSFALRLIGRTVCRGRRDAQERRYVQDERYIAREHMDVRRDCVSFALRVTCP